MSRAFQFGQAVRELRIHLCQTSPASSGVRQFIEKHYVDLKTMNKNTPILIRECANVQPKLWARYEFGKEAHLPLTNMSESQVLSALEKLTKK
jgi:NADH dehydrogenase (ubiquinone) 1 alpha subcomplex subunit 2